MCSKFEVLPSQAKTGAGMVEWKRNKERTQENKRIDKDLPV